MKRMYVSTYIYIYKKSKTPKPNAEGCMDAWKYENMMKWMDERTEATADDDGW